ncbi:MAG TPA: hypothetical protein DD670_15955 [Planctomycetaceae bacterium]|nr:hypothetical protein [Planctomycetaceae bacterium]
MELKNALAVCLISFFSATIVLLIARALDVQAASRLEPQLTQIAEELQAIRKAGGIAASPGSAADIAADVAADDGLTVYYLHGNMRCPTCRSIESQTQETVQSDFAAEVDQGQLTFKTLNYEKPAGEELGKKFEVMQPVVVVVRTQGGEIVDWKRLDEVWAFVGDPAAFRDYVRTEVSAMLVSGQPSMLSPGSTLPGVTAPDSAPTTIPSSADPGDIPLP